MVNQLTGFFMRTTLALDGLNKESLLSLYCKYIHRYVNGTRESAYMRKIEENKLSTLTYSLHHICQMKA